MSVGCRYYCGVCVLGNISSIPWGCLSGFCGCCFSSVRVNCELCVCFLCDFVKPSLHLGIVFEFFNSLLVE